MNINQKIKAILLGVMFSSTMVPIASAEDIEIYTNLAEVDTANPNIMFVIDNSGSMSITSSVKASYNATKTYSGDCVSDGIYFVDDGKLPVCPTNTNYFKEASNKCDHSIVGYTAAGVAISPGQDGSLLMIGTYSDQLAQFDTASNKWRELSVNKTSDRELLVECFSDSGIHGNKDSSKDVYIENNTAGWTSDAPDNLDLPHPIWSNGAGNLQLFHGNYVNYLSDTSVPFEDKSYLEQVKSAVDIMVRGNTRVNIGLMTFDQKQYEGGYIEYPIVDVGLDRNDFFTRLKTLQPGGYTPLSETYYEALLYFGGRAADYGSVQSVGASMTSGTGTKFYNSPIASTCDNNYVVLLSDGVPKRDYISEDRRKVLPGFAYGECNTGSSSDSNNNLDAFSSATSTRDNCLDELAHWAYTEDVDAGGNSPETGEQNVTTHTIGFQLDDKSAIQLMSDTAEAGGGDFYQASSEAELIDIFNKIIAQVLDVNTTFSSPAVSVNAFNRSTHLNDLYFTLFKPGEGASWAGNLKKYKLDFKEVNSETVAFIADQAKKEAIDESTGFFAEEAISFWSAEADGKEVGEGGVAAVLSNVRNVYTNTGAYSNTGSAFVPSDKDLTSSTNMLDKSNSAVTAAMLGVTGFADKIDGTDYRTTLLDWASGIDVFSEYGDVDTTTDARLAIGDPLHAEPALVQYGLDDGHSDLVAYVATNDGYLHAFDVDDGTEIFSFVPQELLPSLSTAMEGVGAGGKMYGLDGNVVAWINDVGKDGAISASDGDSVTLFIGMRRGGNNIYSIDVTNRTQPKLNWVIKGGIAGGDYEDLGQTWSPVNIQTVKNGTADKTVLVFGGGYDQSQDGAAVRSADGIGNTVFIADAASGQLLWSARDDITDIDNDMQYSIPARITVIDVSGDGYMDRMYAADMGGQIFRFDINNINDASLASSITGGRIADIAGSAAIDARRFYYPPDVALSTAADGKYHALVISSGFRAHPLNIEIHDRIYMIKDRNTGLISSGYKTLTEADLKDVTDNLAGGDSGAAGDVTADAAREAEIANIAAAEGWYIDLDDENNSGTWKGEKGLAEALIIQGVAVVTTFTPEFDDSSTSCEPNAGIGKVFFLDLDDATPAFPSDVDKRAERHIQLVRGGIPPTPSVIVTEEGSGVTAGTEILPYDFGLGISKTYWFEVEK